MSQFREMMSQEEVAHEDAPEPTTGTTSPERPSQSRKKKRQGLKRGERGLNQFPDDTYAITDVSPTGQPLAPEEALPKYRNAIGFCVRDFLDITVKNWAGVSNNHKIKIWDKIKTRFQFPRNVPEDLVKAYTMKQCAVSFRNWRSEMNVKYAKTGMDPTSKYNITKGQWAVFLEQRNDPNFLARSEANSQLAKRNKYHHHLGTGGYRHQVPKWRQEEAAKKAAGLPVLSEQVGERSANWIRARKPKETETGVSFEDPMLDEAMKSIFAVAGMQQEGKFTPRRERDILSVGLGNPEHPGRVRGISSKEGWKDGFGPQWANEYKKRDRYKDQMANYFQEEAKKDFQEMMEKLLENPPPELMQKLASAMSNAATQMSTQAPQMQLVPVVSQPLVASSETIIPSSVASTANKDHYPVDDIVTSTPCSLVIRYGINNHRTREVATGKAIPGGPKYHGADIPKDYCRVEVSTVVQGYEDEILDIPGPEDIVKLGQAINNFILWPRRDVQLREPPPPSQEMPLTQESSAHVDPLPNPPPSPPQSLPDPPESPLHVFPVHQPSPLHDLSTPQSTQSPPPFNSTPSPQLKDPEPISEPPKVPKKKVFLIPKLISPFEPKKKSAGQVRFLSGIASKRTIQEHEISELAKSEVPAPKVITPVNFKVPTAEDYKTIPKKYVWGKPLLSRTKLMKKPSGIKRFHDWYMRASSAGIDTISMRIPQIAFLSQSTDKCMLTFDDMWALMNHEMLDVQIVTAFAL
jgi:hypothetical protein